MVVNTLGHQCLLQVELEDSVFSRVVPQQSLLVLPLKAALCVGAGVGTAVGEDLVNSLFEMFHHQMILLLSVFVLCFRLKSAKFTSVGSSKPIGIFGETLNVQHYCFSHLADF